VGGNHDISPLEAQISGEGLEQLAVLVYKLDVILHIGYIHPPELDPSPALGGDDPRFTSREQLAELVLAGEDVGYQNVARHPVYEVACLGHILHPSPPKDERWIPRGFVESSLGRLNDVNRVLSTEGLLYLHVIRSSVARNHHIGEAQQGC
jgi:hypothetical protein